MVEQIQIRYNLSSNQAVDKKDLRDTREVRKQDEQKYREMTMPVR